jgi:hypothetical protein
MKNDLSGTIRRAAIWLIEIAFGLGFLGALPALGQTDSAPPQQSPVPALVGTDNNSAPAQADNPDSNDDRMMTPPPVSGQTYPIALTTQERSNYLRAGVSFTSAYIDNLEGGLTSQPISDISYSVAPMVSLDETTSRSHCLLTYAPGFTFYQRNSGFNEADQNAEIQFEYRLSPHVTFSAGDGFQKSSNVFNQPPDFSSGTVSGGAQGPNISIIAPVADRLSNSGNVGISYQFVLNDMMGASGTFFNLHYPNPAQVPGLYDSGSQGGLAFYAHRVAKGQYIGVTYQYQRLMSYPTFGLTETQTHAAFLFYTVSPEHHFSISFLGGPQYSDTVQPAIPPLQPEPAELRSWTPAGGASMGWQARLTSFALSYLHVIAGGGGLVGAAKQDSATLSMRQQITRTLNAALSGGYTQNDVIGGQSLGLFNGHTISGTASLQQLVGQHVSVQLGYMRLRQDYANIPAISTNPNVNREFVSISYQFSRPLGR